MKGVQPINILQSINFENYSPQKLNQKARKLTWKKNNSSEIVTECTECTELALLWVQSLVYVSFDVNFDESNQSPLFYKKMSIHRLAVIIQVSVIMIDFCL